MDVNRFNVEVRPYLTEIPIGSQGIAFDRLEMDAWTDEYIARNGRPAERRRLWDAENQQDSRKEAERGGLTSKSMESGWSKAVERVTSQKPKGFSRIDLRKFASPSSTGSGRQGR
jgi:hypothetical protein